MIFKIWAVFVTAAVLAYTLIVGTPFLLHAMLSGNTDILYKVGILGVRMTLWLSGARVQAQGLEKVPGGRGVVFMPNHQSNADPPAIFSVLPPVLVLAKQEFFRVPVLGRAMRLRGFIPVDRKNHERALEAVDKAVAALQAGHSFLAYPEGTRSPDGRLQPFKRGVFLMAMRAGAPIVPVSISGATTIMRKGGLAIHPGSIRITFHDPIPTTGLSADDRDRLIEHVRRAIRQGLTPEEQPLAEDPG